MYHKVLGPILFVLYINDIDDSLNSKILKFADDTKLYGTVNSEAGIESLRLDLQKLVLWSTEWQMLFNIDKCKVLHLGLFWAAITLKFIILWKQLSYKLFMRREI